MSMTKRHLVRALLPLAALLGATAAEAGYRCIAQVAIYANAAYGSLGSARGSSTGGEYIGCGFYGDAGQSQVIHASCQARDAAGQLVSCEADQITSPAVVAAIVALPSDGALYFSWDATGRCATVGVNNFSCYEPKMP